MFQRSGEPLFVIIYLCALFFVCETAVDSDQGAIERCSSVKDFKCLVIDDHLSCSFTGAPNNTAYFLKLRNAICSATKQNHTGADKFSCSFEGANNLNILQKLTLSGITTNENATQPEYCTQIILFDFEKSSRLLWPSRIDRAVSSRNVTLQFNLPELWNDTVWDVQIKSKYHATWRRLSPSSGAYSVNKILVGINKLLYVLTVHLEYYYTQYSIRLRGRGTKCPDMEEYWSDYAVLEDIVTGANRPERGPELTLGSFYVTEFDEYFIYWKELKPQEHNGPAFKYIIMNINQNGERVDAESAEINNNVVEYTGLHGATYEFTIASRNQNGSSPGSTLTTRRNSRLRPLELKSIYRNDSYSIVWKRPPIAVVNYTVFWCHVSELPHICESSFDFQIVPGHATNFTMNSLSESLRFAVAANDEAATSGMEWITCITRKPADLGEIVVFNQTAEKTTQQITVYWSVDCEDVLIIERFHLSYCSVQHKGSEECDKGTLKHEPIEDNNVRKFTLTDLQPKTVYKIWCNMSSSEKTSSVKLIVVSTKAPNIYVQIVLTLVLGAAIILPISYWIYNMHMKMGQIFIILPDPEFMEQFFQDNTPRTNRTNISCPFIRFWNVYCSSHENDEEERNPETIELLQRN